MKDRHKTILAAVSVFLMVSYVGYIVFTNFAIEINKIEDPSQIRWRGIDPAPMLMFIGVLVVILCVGHNLAELSKNTVKNLDQIP